MGLPRRAGSFGNQFYNDNRPLVFGHRRRSVVFWAVTEAAAQKTPHESWALNQSSPEGGRVRVVVAKDFGVGAERAMFVPQRRRCRLPVAILRATLALLASQ